MRAVREVQAEHIGTGGDQRVDDAGRRRAGPSVAMIFVCRTVNLGVDGRRVNPSVSLRSSIHPLRLPAVCATNRRIRELTDHSTEVSVGLVYNRLMTTLVHPAVVQYVTRLSRLPHPQLDVVADEGRAEGLPLVYPDTGALLHTLAARERRTAHSRDRHGDRLLDAVDGDGAAGDGALITMEYDADRAARRARSLRRGRVTPTRQRDRRRRDALPAQGRRALRPDLPGRRQETVRADARSAVELLRPGGLLVADNILWNGEVIPG